MNGIRLLTTREMEQLADHPQEAQRLGKAMARRLVDCWRSGELAGSELTKTVPKVWFQCIFPLSWVPAATWAQMFDGIGYCVNGRPADRPAEPVTLYRGVATCRNARRMARKYTGLPPELGWSWTDDPDQATTFAEHAARGAYTGPWAVYRIDAPPAALLARIAINDEHVIDTSRLAAHPVVGWSSGDDR